MIFRELAKKRQVLQSLLVTTDLDQPTGTFATEKGEDEDNTSKHDVHAVGTSHWVSVLEEMWIDEPQEAK